MQFYNDFKKPVKGFTLIEVITVIIILSILAVLGGKFVVESTNSYQTTQIRSRLVNTGRPAIERMSRQLRGSLPYSVRITNANQCVEFMPIASGGNYIGFVADTLNAATPASVINVSPGTIDFGNARFMTIGAMADDLTNGIREIYGASPVSLATVSAWTATKITLSTAYRWRRNSLNQRFYVLDNPQAFCVVNGQLRFYDNQDVKNVSSQEVNLNSTFSLLAENVSASTPFSLTSGSENRNTIVQINITFASQDASVAFNNSVMIRNVP